MAENSTLARPYAKAVFELARDKGALDAWSKTLAVLAGFCADAGVQVRQRGEARDPRRERDPQHDLQHGEPEEAVELEPAS